SDREVAGEGRVLVAPAVVSPDVDVAEAGRDPVASAVVAPEGHIAGEGQGGRRGSKHRHDRQHHFDGSNSPAHRRFLRSAAGHRRTAPRCRSSLRSQQIVRSEVRSGWPQAHVLARAASNALWVIAHARTISDLRTRAFVAERTATGNSRKEITRVL